VRNISTNVNESTIKLTHQREADGRVAITTVLLTTGDTYRESIWAQEAADRARYVNNLCADKPGIGTSERKEIRKEIEKIARATAIDLRFDTSGKVNGRASCSARCGRDRRSSRRPVSTCSRTTSDKRRSSTSRRTSPAATRASRKIARVEKDLDALFRAELQRILTTPAQPSRLGFDPERPEKPAYELIDGVGLIWRKPTAGGGEIPTLLTNFTAKIVANVVRTDGVDRTRDLEIEAALKGRAPQRFTVKATEFEDMRWPMRELGGEAVIEPEDGFNRRARGGDPEAQHERRAQGPAHAHRLDGNRRAVGLPPRRRRNRRGRPAAADRRRAGRRADALRAAGAAGDPAWLKRCIRASLRILELGAAHIVYPLYCSIWRPLLGECDLSTFINGRTQSFKSELGVARRAALRRDDAREGAARIVGLDAQSPARHGVQVEGRAVPDRRLQARRAQGARRRGDAQARRQDPARPGQPLGARPVRRVRQQPREQAAARHDHRDRRGAAVRSEPCARACGSST
jgi:hypothetical protein